MGSRIGLLGLCSDFHSSFLRGPASAPALIQEALLSPSSNRFSELGISVTDHPDFVILDSIEAQNQTDYLALTDQIDRLVDDNLVPLLLGGDHSISFPVLKSLLNYHPGLTILHFDAHPDLYDELDGDRYSHACPFARIMELGGVNRLIQVGVRTMNDHQKAQVERFGVECHPLADCQVDDFNPQVSGPLYISVDMDALDPAYAPGVSHLEPGGLSTRQLLRILQRLKDSDCHIVGADVVEYNPERDINGMTAMVAAKITKEIAGLILSQNPSV